MVTGGNSAVNKGRNEGQMRRRERGSFGWALQVYLHSAAVGALGVVEEERERVVGCVLYPCSSAGFRTPSADVESLGKQVM